MMQIKLKEANLKMSSMNKTLTLERKEREDFEQQVKKSEKELVKGK